MIHRMERRALAFGTENAPALARIELALLEALMVAAMVAFGAALLL
jgi:hypothetical protein